MVDKRPQTSFLPRTELDHQFLRVLGERKGRGELNTPKFTTGKTNLSYRVISHWTENNLLPNAAKKGTGWYKFTLTEMVWLKVVSRLRNFGFSLKKIADIKKSVMWSSGEKANRNYPFLDCYITRAWIYAEDSFIILLANGIVDIGSSLEIDLVKDKLPPENRDMLLISLKGILDELGIDTKKTRMRLPVTKEMAELLKALSSTSKSDGEVNIKIKKGALTEIESTEVISETPDFGKIDETFKVGNEYGEVTAKYEGGKAQSARVKKRRRFK